MKLSQLFSVIILLLSIAGAAALSPVQETEKSAFGDIAKGKISPPTPPPDIEEGIFSLEIELKDSSTKSIISNAHATIELQNLGTNDKRQTIRFIGEAGTFQEYLAPANYKVILKVDKLSTDGKDFYGETTVDLKSDKKETVLLLPAGSVRGEVLKSRKIIQAAKVGFSCSGSYGDLSDVETNEFGVFEGEYLPIGNCRVSARSDNLVGNKSVQIEQGKLKELKINLSGEIETSTIQYVILVLIVLGAIGVFVYKHKTDKLHRVQKIPQRIIKKIIVREKIVERRQASGVRHQPEIEITSRMRDLMETLNEKETQIVNFLIENNGNATQAKIMHNTGIPKASLSRYIDRLEQKKIIETIDLGKVNKIKLSKWFLKGEK